jgi:hypothetical protein
MFFPANLNGCDNRLSFDAGPPHPLPICDHSALPSTSVTLQAAPSAVSMVAPTSAVTISRAAEIFGEDQKIFLIGFSAASVPHVLLSFHPTIAKVWCCSCRCGHVGNALALSIMSTALSMSAPVVPSRHTAVGIAIQVDVLVFERAPQSFDEHVAHTAPAAIHGALPGSPSP